MKLSDIRAALREIKVSPSKRLGQNFLHDQNLGRWIVDQAQITAEDYIVEIGPGLGALTEFILEKGAHVLAIEKDRRLADFLRTRLNHQRLEVLNIDALVFDPRVLFARRRVKLLANLPYNISSPLLLKLLEHPNPISLLLLMLQKEVAMRLSAEPSTHEYGALTLRVQLHQRVKYVRTVPASVFFPRPDVDSAVVRIVPRDSADWPEHDDHLVLRLIRIGFSQRRKQLRKLLRGEVDDWDGAARALNIAPNVRAEELSLAKWIALANFIAPTPGADTRSGNDECFAVVDKDDEILRHASRSEVHGNNLRHRAVHILLFNDSGELYLQQRSRWKDRHPLKWDSSAAGHVAAGESYDQTAQRELNEELGVTVALHKFAKLPASNETDQEFVCVYHGTISGDLRPERSEIEQATFLPPRIVDAWTSARPEDFAPAFLQCWKMYRQKIRGASAAESRLNSTTSVTEKRCDS